MISSLLIELGEELSPDVIEGELPLPLAPDEIGEEGPADEIGAVPPVAVETGEELLVNGYGPVDPDGMEPLEIPEGNTPEEYTEDEGPVL